MPPLSRPLASWSRTDSLVVEIAVLVLGAAAVVTGLVLPLLWVAGLGGPWGLDSVPITLVEAPELPDVASGAEGVTATATGTVLLVLEAPDTALRLLLAAPRMAAGACVAAACYLVFRMARTLREGDPFVVQNARRMFGVAWITLLGGLFVPVLGAFASVHLQMSVLDEWVLAFSVVDPDNVPVPLLLVGMLLIALAEVFRRGAAMREELRGVV